jgi:putative peptide zinc metalloprotease protein
MPRFEPDARVAVRPFARHHEGDDVTVGLLDQQVFVTIPAEGVEILDALAAGATVGEAAREYADAHGETADIVDFLEALADAGFVVNPSADDALPIGDRLAAPPQAAPEFRWISPALARRVVGAPTACICAIAIATGAALFASDPSLVPGATVLVFHRNLAAWLAVVFAVNTAGVIVHELGHVLAARAAGVPARIRISHRLWFIVAETDMTGIWLAPPRSRQRAFLAGPTIDAVCASALLGLRRAQHSGWLALSPTLQLFVAATLMTYLLRLLWQCFVFVRTDFYYVLATALGAKNLLSDTEGLLHNWAARALGRPPAVDQSPIPPRERRAIRRYAAVWLGGRAIALYSLAFAALPVLAGYGTEMVRTVTGGRPHYSLAGLVTVALLVFGMQAAGLVLWIRSLYLSRTKGASHDVAVQ